jgi:hypothetical protein
MPKRGVAEIVASLALLGVTISLSGGLAVTYYGWLHGYATQSALMEGEAAELTSSKVYVVASSAGPPARIFLVNTGERPSSISEVYSDGSLLSASQWLLLDAVTGDNSSSLLPGHLYELRVDSVVSVVVYFDDLYSVEVGTGP